MKSNVIRVQIFKRVPWRLCVNGSRLLDYWKYMIIINFRISPNQLVVIIYSWEKSLILKGVGKKRFLSNLTQNISAKFALRIKEATKFTISHPFNWRTLDQISYYFLIFYLCYYFLLKHFFAFTIDFYVWKNGLFLFKKYFENKVFFLGS